MINLNAQIMHFSCIYEPFRAKIEVLIMSRLFNIDVYRERQLLFFTLVLKIVDMSKVQNNLNVISLAHCFVINWISKRATSTIKII